MKKKFVFIFSALYFITILTVFSVYADENAQKIKVFLNDQEIHFSAQEPTVVDRRTLIPLRGVFEEMGYSISWEPNTKTSTISNNLQTITIRSGHRTMQVDGRAYTLDVTAQIINNSLMIPLRAVAECTGANVIWDADTKSIYVSSNQKERIAINADDYVKEYADIADSLNRVETLFRTLDSLTARNFNDRVDNLKVLSKNAEENLEAAYNKLNEMNVPDEYAEFHDLSIEAVGVSIDLCRLVYDMAEGNLNYNAAALEIDELYGKARVINSKMYDATSGLNLGLYR